MPPMTSAIRYREAALDTVEGGDLVEPDSKIASTMKMTMTCQ